MELEVFSYQDLILAIKREDGRLPTKNVGPFPEAGKYNRTCSGPGPQEHHDSRRAKKLERADSGEYGDEVLMQADLAELKAEPRIIEAIQNVRMGRVEVQPGDGGKYGEVRLTESVGAEGQKGDPDHCCEEQACEYCGVIFCIMGTCTVFAAANPVRVPMPVAKRVFL